LVERWLPKPKVAGSTPVARFEGSLEFRQADAMASGLRQHGPDAVGIVIKGPPLASGAGSVGIAAVYASSFWRAHRRPEPPAAGEAGP
jgi:hypothetical protein